MNRHTTFGSPYLLGFDHLERLLERTARTSGVSYPPYNIEAFDDNSLRITLAVAGFSKEELSVTEEDRQLVVRGKQVEADGIEVIAAALENGLLKIHLSRKQVQPSVRVVDNKIGDMP